MSISEFVLQRDDEELAVPTILPFLPLRDVVVFPFMVTPLLVGREASVTAVEAAMNGSKLLCVAAQKEADTEAPMRDDLHEIGTVIRVLQVIRTPDETLKILVEGLARVQLEDLEEAADHLIATVAPLTAKDEQGPRIEALSRSIKDRFKDYVRLNKRLPDEVLLSVLNLEEIGRMADSISAYILGKTSLKQELLAEPSLQRRLARINQILADELEILEIEQRIDTEVQSQVQRNQREFYLNEQLRAIRKELGYHSDEDNEVEEYAQRIQASDLPPEAAETAQRELSRLARMPGMSPESTVVRNYLDTLLDLPWKKRSRDRIDTIKVRERLDADHYGLDKVKDRIIEFLAVYKLTRKMQGTILCLVGPPGVGKTSLGRSIAESLTRRFVRISLGGVRDEAEIRGHRRTYIGSLPGRILQGMKTAGKVNPVFLLDEVDKMTADFRGDPSSALLEVLDPEQNDTFTDHYLEIPYDLSKVMFVTTANSLNNIPRPLLDRMEVIQIAGYTLDEKLAIARRYRIPRQVAEHGLADFLSITDDAVRKIVTEYTREAGVRQLDRLLAKAARKEAKVFLETPWEGEKVVDATVARSLLGVPPFRDEAAEKQPQVGLAHGLAWTSVGGVTLDIEAVSLPGKGKVALTGQLGDVMKESAQAAIAYLRHHAGEFGLPVDFHESRDLHVHVLEGGTPKDGPSAGIAMATAVVSALTGRPVRGDVAMTGEITLRGRVLAIGGVKEKLLAAHQAGIHHVILPQANQANLEEVPEAILGELTIITVRDFDEVVRHMLDLEAPAEPDTIASADPPSIAPPTETPAVRPRA